MLKRLPIQMKLPTIWKQWAARSRQCGVDCPWVARANFTMPMTLPTTYLYGNSGQWSWLPIGCTWAGILTCKWRCPFLLYIEIVGNSVGNSVGQSSTFTYGNNLGITMGNLLNCILWFFLNVGLPSLIQISSKWLCMLLFIIWNQ